MFNVDISRAELQINDSRAIKHVTESRRLRFRLWDAVLDKKLAFGPSQTRRIRVGRLAPNRLRKDDHVTLAFMTKRI